jgi:hypothetical protein
MLKKISTYILCLFCLWIAILPAQAESATLHALVIGDTMEGSVDVSTECNVDLMQREIIRIALFSGMELDLAIFEGYHVTERNIVNHIKDLNVDPDDLVMFFCFCHGSREKDKLNQWPNLRFTLDLTYLGTRPDFGKFIELLQNKQPRLLFAFAESCNEFIVDDRVNIPGFDDMDEDDLEVTPEIIREAYEQTAKKGPTKHIVLDEKFHHIKAVSEEKYSTQYKKLYLEPSGVILMSSSIPGHTSIRDPDVFGGLFTSEFLRTFRNKVLWDWQSSNENAIVLWKNILDETSQKVQEHHSQVLEGQKHAQIPQFQLNLH